MPLRPSRRAYGLLLSIMFLAAITLPLAGIFVSAGDPSKEKRRLASPPQFPATIAELERQTAALARALNVEPILACSILGIGENPYA